MKSNTRSRGKVKQPSKKTLKANAWRYFSQFIRLRDCFQTTGTKETGVCISCGRTLPFAQLDAGHFIPKRSGNYFSERGVNIQCRSCNRFHGGNQLEYRKGIIAKYGDGIDLELEEESRQIKKYLPESLTELAECYKIKVKGLLEE